MQHGDSHAGVRDRDRWEHGARPLVLHDRPMLVVCPHPADESFGCGGLISSVTRSGGVVRVIAVSDGDAAYDGWDPAELAAVRRSEHAAALLTLGVGESATCRLLLPDGRLDAYLTEIERAIDTAAHALGRPLIVAPWASDPHPDHVACGSVAREVARRRGLDCLAYIVRGWPNDPAGLDVVRHRLADRDVVNRRVALASHVSQVDPPQPWLPIVSREMLDGLTDDELFVLTERGMP